MFIIVKQQKNFKLQVIGIVLLELAAGILTLCFYCIIYHAGIMVTKKLYNYFPLSLIRTLQFNVKN